MGVGRSRAGWVAGVVAALALTGARPAPAAEPLVQGQALALSVTAANSRIVPPTPAGVAGSGVSSFATVTAES